VFLATDGIEPPVGFMDRVQVERVIRDESRPKGPRFGSLVHLVMSDIEFNASRESIARMTHSHGRLLSATAEELTAAVKAVAAALRHPLLIRARNATRLYRELPLVIKDDSDGLLEAVLDLAFLEESGWIIVDFKTDAEDEQRLWRYRRQLGWYLHSMEQTTGNTSGGYLLHL
jgi:ATP-dependent exoDNAse (exonuclease V) beta subunit